MPETTVFLFQSWEEAQKNEMVQKAGQIGSKVAEKATQAAQSAKSAGETIGKTDVFKTVTDGVKSVKEELDEAAKVSSRHYSTPCERTLYQSIGVVLTYITQVYHMSCTYLLIMLIIYKINEEHMSTSLYKYCEIIDVRSKLIELNIVSFA